MSALPYDHVVLTTEEKDALIADPVNRGLTAQKVIERLGGFIAGSASTVRRVRRRAGLDSLGYPAHASHHFHEVLPDVSTDDESDKLMRSHPTGRRESVGRESVRVTAGARQGSRRAKRARWPAGPHVYFIQAGDSDGPVKIGCTRDLTKRLATLATQGPLPITVLGFIPGYEPTEQHLHELFAADRQHGEWFSPSKRLLDLAHGRAFLAANGQVRTCGQLGDS